MTTRKMESVAEDSSRRKPEPLDAAPAAQEVAERAYWRWISRGCPMGSPEDDWYAAEHELQAPASTARD